MTVIDWLVGLAAFLATAAVIAFDYLTRPH